MKGKSPLIMLDKVKNILAEKWYLDRVDYPLEVAKRVIELSAKLIKNAMNSCDKKSEYYPTIDEIQNNEVESPVNYRREEGDFQAAIHNFSMDFFPLCNC